MSTRRMRREAEKALQPLPTGALLCYGAALAMFVLLVWAVWPR